MASRSKKKSSQRRYHDRRLTVRSIRRDPPDISKLSKALIGLAMAEAEREAQAEQQAREATSTSSTSDKSRRGGTTNA